MARQINNRQVRIPGAKREIDVADYCRQHKLTQQEEHKLTRLFGRFATRQELEANAQKSPKHR